MGDSDDPVERMLAVVKWVFSKDSKWIVSSLIFILFPFYFISPYENQIFTSFVLLLLTY